MGTIKGCFLAEVVFPSIFFVGPILCSMHAGKGSTFLVSLSPFKFFKGVRVLRCNNAPADFSPTHPHLPNFASYPPECFFFLRENLPLGKFWGSKNSARNSRHVCKELIKIHSFWLSMCCCLAASNRFSWKLQGKICFLGSALPPRELLQGEDYCTASWEGVFWGTHIQISAGR